MAAFTFPGVYIQEIPSGVHTITGVATSIAAFVGWAAKGPSDQAVLVQSWGDFDRQFGGLDSRSYLGYAVNQFFGNGGQQAYIVRLVNTADATQASVEITAMVFIAPPTPGGWQPGATYTYGNLILDPNNNVQICQVGGQSAGATQSTTWATTVGSKTVDNQVTWKLIGSSTSIPSIVAVIPGNLSATWKPDTDYNQGTLILDANNAVQLCTAKGKSGTSVPSWATTIGATTAENNSVIWTLVAPAVVTQGGLTLNAVNRGVWGNNYSVQVQPNPIDYTRFSLSVIYTDPNTQAPSTAETFPNLSLSSSDARYVVNIINERSNFITAKMDPTTALAIATNPSPLPQALPPPGTGSVSLVGGNDGTALDPTDPKTSTSFEAALNADGSGTGGVHLLDTVPIFNLLAVPGEADPSTIGELQAYCVGKRAFLIADSQSTDSFSTLQNGPNSLMTGSNAINSAFYFPWVNAFDSQQNRTRAFPPSGFVAGLYAATDSSRGVWKAPAGIDASLTGQSGLAVPLSDLQNGTLNIAAINCMRHFPVYGDVIWGARTLRGNDQVGSEWKYVPIRRLALFLESSLYDGTQWAVFEPNDERLWSQLRLNIGAFMQGLFLRGAFQGTTPQQAYFVKCDSENNPQSSIDQGIVTVLVGFAPLYPAEFVVI